MGVPNCRCCPRTVAAAVAGEVAAVSLVPHRDEGGGDFGRAYRHRCPRRRERPPRRGGHLDGHIFRPCPPTVAAAAVAAVLVAAAPIVVTATADLLTPPATAADADGRACRRGGVLCEGFSVTRDHPRLCSGGDGCDGGACGYSARICDGGGGVGCARRYRCPYRRTRLPSVDGAAGDQPFAECDKALCGDRTSRGPERGPQPAVFAFLLRLVRDAKALGAANTLACASRFTLRLSTRPGSGDLPRW